MKSSWSVRTCRECGRLLQPGETCNCRQPVKGMPKDGLRASCPLFKYRGSFYNRYFITCQAQAGRQFHSSDERNEFYSRHCCKAWQGCEIYKAFHDEGSAEK